MLVCFMQGDLAFAGQLTRHLAQGRARDETGVGPVRRVQVDTGFQALGQDLSAQAFQAKRILLRLSVSKAAFIKQYVCMICEPPQAVARRGRETGQGAVAPRSFSVGSCRDGGQISSTARTPWTALIAPLTCGVIG